MKELDFNYDTSVVSGNESIQKDTFEPRNMYGSKERYIFDFTKVYDVGGTGAYSFESGYGNLWFFEDLFGPGPYGGAAAKDSRGNYAQDVGETNQQSWNQAGYKGRWFLNNLTYWDQSWKLLGVPENGEFIFKDNPCIYMYGQPLPTLPTLSYVETPSTGNLTSDDGRFYQQTLAPYINKDIAFRFGSSQITSFRSGYIEFTIKTDNQNCIIASGFENGKISEPTVIDDKTIVKNISGVTANSFKINIKDGKLNVQYKDIYGKFKENIEITSNKTIADNEWHHVVINIGKPGINRTKTKRHNKSFIEIFIDGKSDIIDYSIDKKQIFFPIIQWLFVDPGLTFSSLQDPLAGYDTTIEAYTVPFAGGGSQDITIDNYFVGNAEEDNITKSIFNSIAESVNFSGSLNTFVLGINSALSTEDIQLRYALYSSQKLFYSQPFIAKSEMIQPTVSVNKKKALKLFWNTLNKNKNGIELDNNFLVNTYCVTHSNVVSSTETYNIDLSSSKEIKYLKDVRAVFIDNINIFGPGKLWNQSLKDLQDSNWAFGGLRDQQNLKDSKVLDSVRYEKWWPPEGYRQTKEYSDYSFTDGALINMPFSGLNLNDGDRILLTNQIKPEENGIYIFNGYNNLLTIPEDLSSPELVNNGVVRVVDGYFKNTSWILKNNISSIGDNQYWSQLENHPKENDINAQPILSNRWSDEDKQPRFIDLENDINISSYDLIVFMNYPETNEEIKQSFVGYDDFEIKIKYDNFIKSLQNVCAQGANLYVSSPKLAQDLGIVKTFTEINQEVENGDGRSADINPFQPGESASRYFDTHRQNKYHLATEVPGLTDKETYLLTDFINYVPETQYEYDEYHAKYSYRQFGLQEGNEFIIPGSTLRQITENENLPGFKANQLGSKSLMAIAPSDILAGTVVTKLPNTYYHGSEIADNEYDDYATTIIVHDGQLLENNPINGKIFVNCIEDGYTFSREEYNKAMIQVIPENETNESIATRAWQYSTSRLNRSPQRINVTALTINGQTTPTNGGGGPLIQSVTNSSNGIIRSETDKNNADYQSDFYAKESEEIYPLQEIPVLSMTWLGLQWLAG